MSPYHNHLIRLCCSVLLLWNASWAALPAQPYTQRPYVKIRGSIGVNTHFASRSQSLDAIPAHAALAADFRTSWAREDFHWYRIQRTPTSYDWSFTDTTVDALQQQGIQILGVLGHPPGWATQNPDDDPYDNSFSAPDPAHFALWAAQTVERYRGRVTYWQIWNEPDNPQFWLPAPDPLAYAALVHQTAMAIARVAPEVHLVAAGVNPFAPQFLSAAAAAGLWNDIDIIAIHPYVNPTDPRYAGLSDAVQYLAPVMHRYGPKPIWVTEFGWGSTSSDRDPPGSMTEERQAAYLKIAVPILWQSGISHVFWYSWKDEQSNPYGLFRWASGPDDMSRSKPAATVYRDLLATQSPQLSPRAQTLVLDFEGTNDIWVRGDEHTGVLYPTQRRAAQGTTAVAITYAFPSGGNQYLVFRRWHHAPIPNATVRLCMMVWGDNTSTMVKVWLRGSDQKRVQLVLGLSGATGWREICAPLPPRYESWNQIDPGDGILHQPATFEALVLDDAPDGAGSSGTIFVDALRADSD